MLFRSLVAAFAASGGSPGLAVGNAIGSNITNIALVLGCTAVVAPMVVHSSILKREYPLLFFATLLVTVCMAVDNYLGWVDALIFASTLLLIMFWLIHQAMSNRNTDPLIDDFEHEIPSNMPMKKALWLLVLGIIILMLSSRLLVLGAVNIATELGVSDLIIGLTIVAIGTSLPELAASVASALKGHTDIALGNVVGSNIFNIAAVMAVPGLLAPIALESVVFWRDYGMTLGLTLLLAALALYQRPPKISRFEGGLLLAAYAGYLALLYNMNS